MLTAEEIDKISINEFGRIKGAIAGFKINIRTGKVTQLTTIDTDRGFKKNKMPDIFRTNLISHLIGTGTPALGITNVSLSTDPRSITNTSGTSLNISRIAAPSPIVTYNDFVIEYSSTFGNDQLIATKKTTVTAVTSKSVITVSNASGFRPLDGVILTMANLANAPRENQILSIVGNIITFVADFEVLPAVTDVLDQSIYRVELNYNTGITFDTGNCISIATLKTTKTDEEIIKVKHRLSLFTS